MVTHVLRDGRRLGDITGHVVRADDLEGLQDLIRRIEKRMEVYGNEKKDEKSGT